MLQPPFLLRRAASNARRINGPAFSGMPDFFRGEAGRTSVEPEQLSADAFPIVGPGTACGDAEPPRATSCCAVVLVGRARS